MNHFFIFLFLVFWAVGISANVNSVGGQYLELELYTFEVQALSEAEVQADAEAIVNAEA